MMLSNAQDLNSYSLRSEDGIIGKVKDFYFDDQDWSIRYLVVDTGAWLSSRKVLISPLVLKGVDRPEKAFPVRLNREQVRRSPEIDTEKPVSRQHETDLSRYYGWPAYWTLPGYGPGVGVPPIVGPISGAPYGAAGPSILPSPADAPAVMRERSGGDPHLRSTGEVRGYHIETTDGEVGHVDDFLIDETTWDIRYLVVDTRNWWPGKKVLVSPRWIKDVDWAESKVFVDLTRDAIKSSPAYVPSKPVDEAYSRELHGHYDRPL